MGNKNTMPGLKVEREKTLERKLADKVKKMGGIALKFTPFSFTGIPDRIVLLPGGIMFFAELKETNEKMRPRQEYVKNLLERLGFRVELLDTSEKIEKILAEYDKK